MRNFAEIPTTFRMANFVKIAAEAVLLATIWYLGGGFHLAFYMVQFIPQPHIRQFVTWLQTAVTLIMLTKSVASQEWTTAYILLLNLLTSAQDVRLLAVVTMCFSSFYWVEFMLNNNWYVVACAARFVFLCLKFHNPIWFLMCPNLTLVWVLNGSRLPKWQEALRNCLDRQIKRPSFWTAVKIAFRMVRQNYALCTFHMIAALFSPLELVTTFLFLTSLPVWIVEQDENENMRVLLAKIKAQDIKSYPSQSTSTPQKTESQSTPCSTIQPTSMTDEATTSSPIEAK